ncbi:hypothetical protein [Phenylobacterium sp.]|uniref:hypothetical protein n=1 Tax=Phenylobacterium sp. TaxID=1871053 RepID=UPI002E32F05F|nr:hypothetical protein [Phenylobacterium sp.]HEX4709701.1 hypothetical protein [Phenylobacterium sp.]
MQTFDAAQFQKEYATELGRRLWLFLNRDDVVARMETATDLGQPALQAVEDQLLETFGEAVLADRIKQMIGRMVRQVMETNGFEHVTSDVRLNSVPFYKASRYRRRDQAMVYLFKSSSDPRDMAVSATRNPDLPALDQGRWVFVNALSSPLKAQIGYGFDLKAAAVRAAKGPFRHRMERVLRPA